ncbi:MAG TPA: hypothetical protein VMV69_23515 [Pirellulales bacterium]|nr:hypothetical protein [Pirellulales bacterium]
MKTIAVSARATTLNDLLKKGVTFVTLEDETGVAKLIVRQAI